MQKNNTTEASSSSSSTNNLFLLDLLFFITSAKGSFAYFNAPNSSTIMTSKDFYIFLVTVCYLVATAEAMVNPFFKEILTGRCYTQPPTGHPDDIVHCPDIVASIVGVLDGNLDELIDAESFSTYMKIADFSAGDKGGIFWLRNDAASNNGYHGTTIFMTGSGLNTPETTPGGLLLSFLTFCGVNQRDNCQYGTGTAFTAFWTSAYAKYGSSLQGNIHVVVDKNSNLVPFLQGALPSLNWSNISSFNVYADDCNAVMEKLVLNYTTIQCTEDYEYLTACMNPDSSTCNCWKTQNSINSLSDWTYTSTDTQRVDNKKGKNNPFKVLFFSLLALFSIVGYIVTKRIQNDYENIPTAEATVLQPKQ